MLLGSKSQVGGLELAATPVAINDIPVVRVSEARNLGLVIDEDLRFESHVAELARNCFYRLSVLYRIRPYVNEVLRVRLCEALILSKLNYCITVYGPCLYKKTLRIIQRIQNACARFCFKIPPRSHVTPFLNSANLLNMKSRCQYHLACLLFGINKTGAPKYLSNRIVWSDSSPSQRSQRSCRMNRIILPLFRTVAFRGSFKYAAAKCWNNIPPPIRNVTSRSAFKFKLKLHLLELQKNA